MIEDPKGSTERHVWDEATAQWTAYQFLHTSEPWPAHYGYIPGTRNPADGDALDVLLLSSASLRTGDTIAARAVGVLLRPDGDHKILSIALDDPNLVHVSRFSEVPSGELRSIESWFRTWSNPPEWDDEVRARAMIASFRDGAASSSVAE